MLLLVHIDSVLCVEASIHPIPAAVTKSVQPDPKLNHNDNVYQHTQTHKYIKRCAKRDAVLLTAAAPLSTPKSPPSQLPTPLPAASLRSNKLHSCVGPAWSCAAAAAQTQDGTHLPALVQRKKVRVKQTQQLRLKALRVRHERRWNHGNARHADRRAVARLMPKQAGSASRTCTSAAAALEGARHPNATDRPPTNPRQPRAHVIQEQRTPS